ncbi:hypothetical protein I3843_12G082400 [Carya illinoinensis]|uniref:Uncharacterized protein n=1 Tax=Carya illinoinensis TaxID=32201 RepID=A0A8T1NXF0_CARIL|nr:uncharacterized protein LOC122289365 [Carya illinoinensis]KAG2677047.1 hypothetical protein I3760_12G080300 [Carya illinoinensis]KAG6633934.1 hypothetical protein CIPAW_12G082900 [Carya illinoinensis]KAG7952896.1 hypothetical protein I3843_12G082400 [Carya illinoinensis]
MGNCMETCTQRLQAEEMQQQECERSERASGTFVQESNFGKGAIRVKIVLTKEELEWFMLQLKDKEGKKLALEDVFMEIERGREPRSVEGWKPSLESIMESPELLEMDRS